MYHVYVGDNFILWTFVFLNETNNITAINVINSLSNFLKLICKIFIIYEVLESVPFGMESIVYLQLFIL